MVSPNHLWNSTIGFGNWLFKMDQFFVKLGLSYVTGLVCQNESFFFFLVELWSIGAIIRTFTLDATGLELLGKE